MSLNFTRRYICSECGSLAKTSADPENISIRGIKETITALVAFGFLKIIEYSTSFVDRLPVFGYTSLIMKRVTASFLFYLAEETQMCLNIRRPYVCSECGSLAKTSADVGKYTSFRGMKETIIVLATFGFLKIVERSTSFVDQLPVFGYASLIMRRVIASFLSYLAEEPKEEKPTMSDEVQIPTDDFDKVFPVLMDDLVKHTKEYGIPKDTLDWFHNSLKHNVVGGKANRGRFVVDTTSDLLGRPLTDEEYFQSAVLGWCAEILQAAFLIADDIMDSSQTRRGSTCWYLMPNVGMTAMNDAFMIVSSIFILLRKYFSCDKNYTNILELFQEVMFKTEIGQLADLLTAPEAKLNFDQFSFERYRFIVNFKTSYYSFFLPATLSLYQLDLATPKNPQQAEKILLLTGEYFQVQDDYLDAFGDPEIMGKIGTDIRDNKCSWLINEALKRANPQQRKTLEDNYGKKYKSAETKVKEMYTKMDLENVYRKYEDEKVGQIREAILSIDESEGLKKSIFEGFLNKIHKRRK